VPDISVLLDPAFHAGLTDREHLRHHRVRALARLVRLDHALSQLDGICLSLPKIRSAGAKWEEAMGKAMEKQDRARSRAAEQEN
jgi:hypothetical protein